MTTLTLHIPRTAAEPRGAWLAAALYRSLADALLRLEARQTQRLQQRQEDRRAADASAVRRYAKQVMAGDPGFASDLFAAADRHEQFRD